MLRKYYFPYLLIAVLASFFIADCASAQVGLGQPARRIITQTIDESKIVTLAGNTRSEANAKNDRGVVTDYLPLEHMQVQLRLPIEKEQQLEQFIQELHDPSSPNFHKWLTPDQFKQEFSVAQDDIDAITNWLQSHGFTINVIYPRSIDFSGTAGQVRAAFRTEIHNLEVNGARHIANINDPKIPAALAPAVLGVVSLNDFMPHPSKHQRVDYTAGGGFYTVVPADLATIYNFNPLFSKGVSGQGQTIVVIEDTDVYSTADWSTFRSTLGLSSYTSASFTQVHPAPPTGTNNCNDPGANGDDDEAILDAEWASAGAPNAAIILASCTNTTANFGGFIALQNLLNESSTPPAIVSISYGDSESDIGATGNAYINALYQQAVTEGVSVFVSSGDQGAASSDYDVSAATHGITVSGYTSTPYNVSVGGTDFGDYYTGTISTYWASVNTSVFGSAKSYIPEIPWNNSCASQIFAAYEGYATTYGPSGFCNSSTGGHFLGTVAGSGGPSGCATGTPSISDVVSGTCAGYAKPSWQSVFGNPSDGVRDIPDVSLFAANGLWGHYYVVCFSDPGNGGSSCAGAPNTWSGYGGTSISSPIMAAIQALINQTIGSSSGNPNSTYYSLARAEYGSGGDTSCSSSLGNGVSNTCVFYDVTAGDIDVNCTGSHNCYLDSAARGVLSKSNSSYQPAYGTNTGWDFSTGIGTVNAYNLVTSWPKSSNPAVLSITKTHTGSFAQSQQNATYTVTVSNSASAGPTSGTVTVAETAPSGLTLISMAGTGWTCATNTCTRSDTLTGGASYPTITVTVNVVSNASSPQVNQVSVSGGGSAPANANDSTTITGLLVGPTATFVGTDTATQGSWQGKYGADGYSIANTVYQRLPSYSTLTPTGTAYTWVSNTTDARALAIPGGTGGIASCWYNNSVFSFDVNITDGKTHQIALYALDWDTVGRAETISIVDANNPNTVLSMQSISNFNGGTYLVWNVSGHVTFNVTRTGGLNAVISGVFFGTGNQIPTAPVITSLNSTTFAVGTPGTFTVTASGFPIPTLSETGTLPSGITFNTTTGVLSGTPAAGTNASYPLMFTANNSVGSNTQNFTLTVNPASATTATFVGTDTATQGSWQGKYGADGYSIANTVYQRLPSYSTLTPTGTAYTWVSNTTDARALAIPGGTGGIASCWYNNSVFSFDVNITDGKTHQIALYALDWDTVGRAETISIVDANNPNTVLSMQSISNFNGGTYLVWNVSGHVTFNVTRTGGLNAVISGVFFGTGNQIPTAPVITSLNSTTFAVGTPGTFTVTASGFPIPTLSETGTLPSGITFNTTTGVLSGTPAAGTNASYPLMFTANNSVGSNTQNFTLTVNPASATTATFVGTDTATQGSWQGKYGADGYSIANTVYQSLPSYSTLTPTGTAYTWVSNTTDARALAIPGGTGGIASCWYNNSVFSFDVNITDGKTHQIALYALDWDTVGRAETISIVDANNPNTVLSMQSISNFNGGTYLVWNVSGHVTFNVTRTGGLNAVISGVFFK